MECAASCKFFCCCLPLHLVLHLTLTHFARCLMFARQAGNPQAAGCCLPVPPSGIHVPGNQVSQGEATWRWLLLAADNGGQ